MRFGATEPLSHYSSPHALLLLLLLLMLVWRLTKQIMAVTVIYLYGVIISHHINCHPMIIVSSPGTIVVKWRRLRLLWWFDGMWLMVFTMLI